MLISIPNTEDKYFFPKKRSRMGKNTKFTHNVKVQLHHLSPKINLTLHFIFQHFTYVIKHHQLSHKITYGNATLLILLRTSVCYRWATAKHVIKRMIVMTFLSIFRSTIVHVGRTRTEVLVKNPSANAGDVRDMGSIPSQKDPLEEGMATHSSILAWRIPMDRGAWRATVHRVA